MILVRNIFQANFGKAGELAKEFKAVLGPISEGYRGKVRIMTDLSGHFDTVVMEIEIESLAMWERNRAEMFSRSEFSEEFARTAALIEGGKAQFFTIES